MSRLLCLARKDEPECPKRHLLWLRAMWLHVRICGAGVKRRRTGRSYLDEVARDGAGDAGLERALDDEIDPSAERTGELVLELDEGEEARRPAEPDEKVDIARGRGLRACERTEQGHALDAPTPLELGQERSQARADLLAPAVGLARLALVHSVPLAFGPQAPATVACPASASNSSMAKTTAVSAKPGSRVTKRWR